MLSLARSRSSLPAKCHRTPMTAFHCTARLGENSSFSGSNLNKEVPVLEEVPKSPSVVTPVTPLESQLQFHDALSSPEPSVETLTTAPVTAVTATDKPKKKNKNKNKKKSEKSSISPESRSEVQSIDEDGNESIHAFQYGVIPDDSQTSTKRSKKGRNECAMKRAEDVDGYCGGLPVEKLVEFIDCNAGRKLNRSKSKNSDDGTVPTKTRPTKKQSEDNPATIESDSGFGDTEALDRVDGSPFEGRASPPLSAEGMVIAVDISVVSEAPSPIPVSSNESAVVNSGPVSDSAETSESSPTYWSAESELTYDGAFWSDDENNAKKMEPDFILVQQKKRRPKTETRETETSTIVDRPAQNGNQDNVRGVFFRGGYRPRGGGFIKPNSASPSDRSLSPLEHSGDYHGNNISTSRFNYDGYRPAVSGRGRAAPFSGGFKTFPRNSGYENNRSLQSGRSAIMPRLGRTAESETTEGCEKFTNVICSKNGFTQTNFENGVSTGYSLPDVIPSVGNSEGGCEVPLMDVVSGCESSVRPDFADAHSQTSAEDFAALNEKSAAVMVEENVSSQKNFDLHSLQAYLYTDFEDVMSTAKSSCTQQVQFYSSSDNIATDTSPDH